MSYEDIFAASFAARFACASTEAAAVDRKCGRKRKSPAPAGVKAKKARRSEAEVAEDEIAAGGMGDYCSVLQV
jgi:hypothetical protein